MPVQTQVSSLAGKLGGGNRLAAANVEHRDAPIDTGIQRLPPGITNGIAKLQTFAWKEYADDKNGPGTKGQLFWRAAAAIMMPHEHGGQKVAGRHTSQMGPLCDMPAKGQRKATTFSQNWAEFLNVVKILSNGTMVCQETPETDPTSAKTEAFYAAAMKALTDPTRPPVYVTFSTRGWTPPATQQQPRPEVMIFETWHELATPDQVAQLNGQYNPAAGVTVAGAPHVNTQPSRFDAPPAMGADGLPNLPSNGRALTNEQIHAPIPDDTAGNGPEDDDPIAEIEQLVAIAMSDPSAETLEGVAATARLEELAWEAGWDKEQTQNANDWAEVGDMAMNPVEDESESIEDVVPAVGSKWKFAKRNKDGEKLKNNKGEEFPPQEVEVTQVFAGTKTCYVKTTRDGTDVVDFRKKPIAVKFAWLES